MSKLQAATSLAPMLSRVMPGVVSLLITGQKEQPIAVTAATSSAEAMLSPPVVEPFRSGGSGVIVDAGKGVILTNDHVIANANRIDVALTDGRIIQAKLLGTDPATDVAVIQINEPNLTAVPFGDSDELRIGDFIAAVGNPFGLEGSASQGIVSAKMRTDIGYEVFEDFIQIDAAVNPGNSGGALVDIDGRLVGLNTATGAAKLRTQGIAFAVPINMARRIADELIAKGTFRRGSLGFWTQDLSFSMAKEKNLPVNRGAAVASVVPGSPAATAGLKAGDVIVEIGGTPVRGHSDYVSRVASTPIGTSLKVALYSDGKPKAVTLTIADIAVEPKPETPPMALRSIAGLTLGASLPGFKSFGRVNGVRILDAKGVAAQAGLKADDIITKVDSAMVRTPQDVFDSVAQKMSKYRVEVFRDGRTLWFHLDAV
ncbi:MAG: trypsin-like peptidase domain-containing protein [Hyphomicrobiaceae bacterium]|nr:trypsin-like peptidase domain-containing protein [Hyphomicrobiaceae bacterium]